MTNKQCCAWSALCAFAMAGAWAGPAGAQAPEVKEKPPLYTYVSNWSIPRARWADMEKQSAADAKIFEKAFSSGALVGYGDDVNLVHEADGDTHDTFWSGLSMASVVGLLDDLHKAGVSAAPVLTSATKHHDELFVSRFYNWKAGSMKNGYTHVASYKLKADAPDDAVARLSKGIIAPLLERMLSEGTVQEYEVDVEAIHTGAPGTFWIVYLTPTAEGLDKVNAAVREAVKGLAGPAFESMVDFTPHRDYLSHTNATYK